MADDFERLRGMSDEVLQKVSNAFDFGETLNVASMRQIVEILVDELEVVISQPDCNGDFEGDVWFGHPEKRTLGTHIWRAGAWHELPSELDAVISLLGQARGQRDANADTIATLRAKVSELETQLRGATIMFSDTAETIATLQADLAKAVEGLEGARVQGQGEGFAAAVQQLRDMSAQKPLNALAAPAAVLANRLERSRSAAQSLIKELRS